MVVTKLAISLAPTLAAAARDRADTEGIAVSQWVADAIERKLQDEAFAELLQDLEAEFGPVTDDEMQAVAQKWQD